MSGYMDLFLETGNPAFYMMAKQEDGSAGAASAGAAGGAENRLYDPRAEEGASPR